MNALFIVIGHFVTYIHFPYLLLSTFYFLFHKLQVHLFTNYLE